MMLRRQFGGLRQLGSKQFIYRKPFGLRCSSSSTATRQWSTPLAREITEAIDTTGPISIATYMRLCLTSPHGGYYTSHITGKDQFGQKGDFITSPEISQIFGELLGIWMVAEWMAQGKISQGVEIIEVGPGRGTLMDDMLRTLSNFKPLASAIEQIYLVEMSPSLCETQRKLLCGDKPFEKIGIGLRSRSKYSNIPITWCEEIHWVPNGMPPPPQLLLPSGSPGLIKALLQKTDPSKTPFIFAHEFFDALPIHAFKSVIPTSSLTTSTSSAQPTPEWRELLVSPTPPSSSPKTTTPEFQLSLSKTPTPFSYFLPTLSPRYSALLPTPNSVIEISPDSQSYVANFAQRIGGGTPSSAPSATALKLKPKTHPSGAALILDYGPMGTIPTSTLRGIGNHTLVSPFVTPGLVDLSADVDFVGLAEAATRASGGVEVHGPVEQGALLEALGIRERAEMICHGMEKGNNGSQGEGKERVRRGMERLVERGGGGMGRLYKALAILPENGGRRRPVGFGGDVVGKLRES